MYIVVVMADAFGVNMLIGNASVSKSGLLVKNRQVDGLPFLQ
jgi:hypothetical protein